MPRPAPAPTCCADKPPEPNQAPSLSRRRERELPCPGAEGAAPRSRLPEPSPPRRSLRPPRPFSTTKKTQIGTIFINTLNEGFAKAKPGAVRCPMSDRDRSGCRPGAALCDVWSGPLHAPSSPPPPPVERDRRRREAPPHTARRDCRARRPRGSEGERRGGGGSRKVWRQHYLPAIHKL